LLRGSLRGGPESRAERGANKISNHVALEDGSLHHHFDRSFALEVPRDMAGALSSVDFLALLGRHDIVPTAELEELARRAADEAALARELVASGKLTSFQVRRLREGKGADLVVGPYRLLDRLGAGGMGEVFRARHRLLDRIDALKLVRADLLGSGSAVARFRQEITAAAKLRHPNIVFTYSADQTPRGLWLAMEFCDGRDLGRVVTDGPLPIARACDCAVQAATGLQHLTAHGLVHRDIKPTNLLLTNGTVKILDFGLARLRPTDDPKQLTPSGILLGSPDFLAPEQARNAGGADRRSDIYGLGCTLYFLLTGQVPFPGGTSWEKVLKHFSGTPIPIERLRPAVPAALGAVVRKMMARDPADRYQTPAEVVEALVLFRGSTFDTVRPDPVPDATELAPPFVGGVLPTPLPLSGVAVGSESNAPSSLALVAESAALAHPDTELEALPVNSRWWFALSGFALAGVIAIIVALWPPSKPGEVPEGNGGGDGPTGLPAQAFKELAAIDKNALDAIPISRIALAPTKEKNHLLAVARGKPNGPGGLEVWSLRDGGRKVLLGGTAQPPICSVVWSPDGNLLVCGAGHPAADVDGAMVTVFDTNRWTVVKQFSTPSQGALALGFPPHDNRQLIVGTRIRNAGGAPSGGMELWSGTDGWTKATRTAQAPDPARVPPVPAPDGPVTAVTFHPRKSSVFAIADLDRKVRIWVIPTEQPGTLRAGVMFPHPNVSPVALGPITNATYSAADSAKGRWLAGVTSSVGPSSLPVHPRQILVWDFHPDERTPTLRTVIPENTSDFCSVAFLPDGTGLVTGERCGRVRVWDLPDLKERAVHLRPLDGHVSGVSFSHDGQLLVAGGTRLFQLPLAALGKK
jgi:serine/threonine protein kinase